MKYRIIFQKAAVKFLRKQEQKTQTRIIKAISMLPYGTDIKKLKGYDLYRLRIGSFRVIYSIDETIMIISIENIDNRGDVYKPY